MSPTSNLRQQDTAILLQVQTTAVPQAPEFLHTYTQLLPSIKVDHDVSAKQVAGRRSTCQVGTDTAAPYSNRTTLWTCEVSVTV